MLILFKIGDCWFKTNKTEADFRKALKRLEEIINAEPGAPESEEHEIFGLMVDDYWLSTITIGTFC